MFLRSRGTRERILIFVSAAGIEIFWTANWPPLEVFAGALGLVFVSTGHKTRQGHVLAFFAQFDVFVVFLELVFTPMAID